MVASVALDSGIGEIVEQGRKFTGGRIGVGSEERVSAVLRPGRWEFEFRSAERPNAGNKLVESEIGCAP
ncbi:hypothetical protein [Mycobacterium numidiamassiliense]|uniref:hypothetical protein n=1 Tax=Mycobacterium numidiamassiliense TaxID=1841861 RepID=UPI00097D5CA7|nr:hypothetical protein [Mycobacterium numidiamassiliense]